MKLRQSIPPFARDLIATGESRERKKRENRITDRALSQNCISSLSLSSIFPPFRPFEHTRKTCARSSSNLSPPPPPSLERAPSLPKIILLSPYAVFSPRLWFLRLWLFGSVNARKLETRDRGQLCSGRRIRRQMRATATPIMPATGNRNDNGLSNNRSGRGREGETMARSRLNSQTIRKISLFPSPSLPRFTDIGFPEGEEFLSSSLLSMERWNERGENCCNNVVIGSKASSTTINKLVCWIRRWALG